MHKTQARLVSLTSRAMAVALMMSGALCLHAQTGQSAATASGPITNGQAPTLNLTIPQLKTDDETAYSSSVSSSGDGAPTEVAATEPILTPGALNAFQYGGGRQRYGRPRYRGGNTNPDGSPKWDFFVGGGFGVPTGNQFNYATTSWGFGGGGGRMWNAHVGVNLEFNYDQFGMTSATLNNQEALYNYYINQYCNSNPATCAANGVTDIAGLDGNNHVWSFTLDPIYNLRSGEGIGAYVTGGFGFYHKVANFTEPAVGEECSIYYGCFEYEANQTIDHYTSNAGGVNVGFGATYKFSRFASERLYGEVRYVYIFNQYRPGVTLATASPANADVANDFPYNSQRTSYFPVKFGLRF